ncbi:hypothetical protein K458DRAFT_383608 [Lentithecium fluviatile CBS 122367]|uniref:Uncharacterized protein n=1 Tax=Lentithecium fluviatile CBS 122367 TaxID=1168545 RepID=A0A6G1JK13_9PLEO|nr:hypothetical protein K458DRAFT_383608 [Lentithecium fluviatile CBS 122367]
MSSQDEEQEQRSTTPVKEAPLALGDTIYTEEEALLTPNIDTDSVTDVEPSTNDVAADSVESPLREPDARPTSHPPDPLPVAPNPGEDHVSYLDRLPFSSSGTKFFSQLHFTGPDQWRHASTFRRDNRRPSIQPGDNPIISQVLHYRKSGVSEMCKATVNLVDIMDGEDSTERRYFELATKSLMALRGFEPKEFDAMAGTEMDQAQSCYARLSNVFMTLKSHERICYDVMTEPSRATSVRKQNRKYENASFLSQSIPASDNMPGRKRSWANGDIGSRYPYGSAVEEEVNMSMEWVKKVQSKLPWDRSS